MSIFSPTTAPRTLHPQRAETNSIHATPLANRAQVGIFGNTNAGKSTLFNRILDQEMAIVSVVRGTTTDPVAKAMELLPFGPITLIDTAGLDDTGDIGNLRVKRTHSLISRCDAALYTADAATMLDGSAVDDYDRTQALFARHQVPHLLVLTKADLITEQDRQTLLDRLPCALLAAQDDDSSMSALRDALSKLLVQHFSDHEQDIPVISKLVPAGGTVLVVVPVDSEAPKGRLILPQVQLIRDCLDAGIRCLVSREHELASAIHDYQSGGIDFVVTDSQAFAIVSGIVPETIPLTSFSMLLAAGKGDFATLVDGLAMIPSLQDGDQILISEACSHNVTHEDIGRVKIPRLLEKTTGKQLAFSFTAGQQTAEDVSGYRLIVHCGACMISKKAMRSRVRTSQEAGVPMTNYGLLLAYGTGTLDRCLNGFRQKGLIG